MKYIFTLSGNSDRFTRDGFIPKPLIKVNDRMVIEYVLDMYPNINLSDAIFIINNRDSFEYNIDDVIKKLYPSATVVSINSHTSGPVVSLLNIEHLISDSDPYIVSYCDLTQKWNYADFVNKMETSKCDGCLVTHTGKHPHRMKVVNFAHVLLEGETVKAVKEKGYFTDNPFSEYASNGIYYFRTGQLLKTYSHRLIENKELVNGEYYVTLIYNQMIRDGLKVIHYPTDNYVCFGTPDELTTFKYWSAVINKKMSDEDIEFIYNYWKKYHGIVK